MSKLYYICIFVFPEEIISAIKLFSIKMILRDMLCGGDFERHVLCVGVCVCR